MGIVPALALIAIALLALKSGALASLGIPAPIAASVNPPPGGLQPNVSLTAPPAALPQPKTAPSSTNALSPGGGPQGSPTLGGSGGLGVIAGLSGFGNAAAPGAAGVASAVGTSLAASGAGFIAGGPIGAVVAGVTSLVTSLANGHKVRMQQATDENSAVNLGVQGYDQGLAQVNQAFIMRSINAVEAIQLVQQIMAYYWAEVNPHIQPGRNGCNGGAACPPYNGCSGSIGAACCVGCYDLIGSNDTGNFPPYGNMYFGILGTVQVLQQGGGSVYYQQVVGSKYGGKNRPAYVLSWVPGAVA